MTKLYEPDIRYKHVLDAQKNPGLIEHLDKYESTLFLYLSGELKPEDLSLKYVRQAYDKYRNDLHKKVIIALFISGAVTEEIVSITGLPKQTIHLFEKLFFDVSIFETRIDYLSYISSNKDESEYLDYYSHAFRMGPDYIKWDLGDKSITFDEKFIAKDIMQSAYIYTKSAMIKQQDIGVIKHWTTITHQYIRLVKDLDIDVKNPLEALVFKLKVDEESKSVDDFKPGDIV